MKQKRLLLALALSGTVLTACSSNPGFELVDAPRQESSGVEETKEVTELMEQEFAIVTEVDDTVKPGEYRIVQPGERGQSNITYEITLSGGKEVSRKALSETVVKKPVEAIVKIAPTAKHGEIGAREIIGYSNPTSPHFVKPTTIGATMTDNSLVLRILADGKVEKDNFTVAQSPEKPHTESSNTQKSRVPDIRIVPAPSRGGNTHTPTPTPPPAVKPKPPVIPTLPNASSAPASSEQSSSSSSSQEQSSQQSSSSSTAQTSSDTQAPSSSQSHSKPESSKSSATEAPPSPNPSGENTSPEEKPAP